MEPSAPDSRDFYFHLNFRFTQVPEFYSIDSFFPAISQHGLNSCVACAIASALFFNRRIHEKSVFKPSVLYIYYFARKDKKVDSGCTIKNALSQIKKYGACSETSYPYKKEHFDKKPHDWCITAGKSHKANFVYYRVNIDTVSIKNAIFRCMPVICGISSFGYLGHCILLVGYDNDVFYFIDSEPENFEVRKMSCNKLLSHCTEMWVLDKFF